MSSYQAPSTRPDGLAAPAAPAAGQPGTAAVESTYRKVFWRIVPFLMLCYVVAYLDRVNVGFAKLQMSTDLAFSETVFGLGAGVFFIGYFLFELPSNILMHKLGARIWIARIMITWGLLSAVFVFVKTPAQFYILRFFLGLAEAGFYPGVILYLIYWFPSHRRAKIIAVFTVCRRFLSREFLAIRSPAGSCNRFTTTRVWRAGNGCS
jgi:sugar phosphate permease